MKFPIFSEWPVLGLAVDFYFEFPTFPEANSFGVLEVYSPRMVSGVRYIVVLEGTVTGMYKEDEVHNEKTHGIHRKRASRIWQ